MSNRELSLPEQIACSIAAQYTGSDTPGIISHLQRTRNLLMDAQDIADQATDPLSAVREKLGEYGDAVLAPIIQENRIGNIADILGDTWKELARLIAEPARRENAARWVPPAPLQKNRGKKYIVRTPERQERTFTSDQFNILCTALRIQFDEMRNGRIEKGNNMAVARAAVELASYVVDIDGEKLGLVWGPIVRRLIPAAQDVLKANQDGDLQNLCDLARTMFFVFSK